MDIYKYFNSLDLVMYPIKKVNKVISNNKIFQQKKKKLAYILKVEINTAIDSVIIAGIETPLNTVFITL